MTTGDTDPLRARLEPYIGKSMSETGPAMAPDEVNLPMIRHWVDALDDHNPVYLDAEIASATRFGGIVAPPAMLQTWTMARPDIQCIVERGGSPVEISDDHPLSILAAAGYTGTLATNSELEFDRYLRPGDRLVSTIVLEAISDRKKTGLGAGYFVTWVITYADGDGEVVGRQRFRILKFAPAANGGAS
jgi:uncharacterized protein